MKIALYFAMASALALSAPAFAQETHTETTVATVDVFAGPCIPLHLQIPDKGTQEGAYVRIAGPHELQNRGCAGVTPPGQVTKVPLPLMQKECGACDEIFKASAQKVIDFEREKRGRNISLAVHYDLVFKPAVGPGDYVVWVPANATDGFAVSVQLRTKLHGETVWSDQKHKYLPNVDISLAGQNSVMLPITYQ